MIIGYLCEYKGLHIVDRVDDVIFYKAHKNYPNDVADRTFKLVNVDKCVVTAVHFPEEDILCCVYSAFAGICRAIKCKLGLVRMSYEIP